MLLKINRDNPQQRKIDHAVDALNKGGIIILPTDTVYAFAANLYRKRAVERLCRLKGIDPSEARLSIICRDISQVSDYTLPFSTSIFRMMKRSLPGPFTFILRANKKVPKLFHFQRNTIGVRIPDNNIAQAVVDTLGVPIITTSIHNDDDSILEYFTDPELISERYEYDVDAVIDGGIGDNDPSTVVDCTNEEPVVLREGKGELLV